jgi:cytochrome c
MSVSRPFGVPKLKSTHVKGAFCLALWVLGGFAHADPLALAQEKHCLSCHAIDHKVVGPAYRDVAKRYAMDAQANARLSEKIMRGGAGSWGVVPMPANNQVSPEQAHELVDWILKQKSP